MALISIIAELERMGWEYRPASEDNVKAKCPFHADSDPSCSISLSKELFKCQAASCGASGDFIKFMAQALKTTRMVVWTDLSKRYDIDKVKTIEPSVVEGYHTAIWQAPHLLKELYLRGVTDASIRLYRLGEHRGRVTIPVKNDGGLFVNIRHYLPGAPTSEKMRNSRGRGDGRLFPIEQLEYDTVVLCGGEVKAIVAAQALNKHNIGAICATAGEGNWKPAFTLRFTGKRVYVCMDIDAAGVKAADAHCARMGSVASWVGNIQLPLDIDKYPKGDLNDFVAREGGDLFKLLEQTKQWLPAIKVADPDEEPTDVSFSGTTSAVHVAKRLRFSGLVSAAAPRTFLAPKRILVKCSKNQEMCPTCAVFPVEDRLWHISPESPAILQFVNVPESQIDNAIKKAIGIPKKCPEVAFEIADHFNVEDVRLNPSLEITNRDSDRTMQQAVCVECEAELNTTYEFVGRLYPHPMTQQATLVIAKSKTTSDALSKYVPQRLPELRIFRPSSWTLEALTERLDDIYADLETNVSRIYCRRDIHLFMDLAFHSVLLVSVNGKTTKGWVEVLIVGDSAQGKTEVAVTLMRHYGLGEKLECKNATVAGLLGGLCQLGTSWYVSWGVIPTHDRKLVLLEELKGASRDVISRLTDMRSSGIAEIPKIEKRRTHARTRLVANSNPRDDRTMSSFAFGVEAVRDLIGAPEDVRRFDAALIVAAGDVDGAVVNGLVRDPPSVRHRYTGELCRELILWAWTRTEAQVLLEPEAQLLITDEATRFSADYSDQIPLVDHGSMRHKLTRLSAALACRTFSTTSNESEVLVRVCHVQYIVAMLRRIYDARSFGYRYFSEAQRSNIKLLDPEVLQQELGMLPFPMEIRDSLLYADEFDMQDMQDWNGWDRQQAQTMMSLLVRKRAIRRKNEGRKYVKTPDFIEFLTAFQPKERPEHLQRQEKF